MNCFQYSINRNFFFLFVPFSEWFLNEEINENHFKWFFILIVYSFEKKKKVKRKKNNTFIGFACSFHRFLWQQPIKWIACRCFFFPCCYCCYYISQRLIQFNSNHFIHFSWCFSFASRFFFVLSDSVDDFGACNKSFFLYLVLDAIVCVRGYNVFFFFFIRSFVHYSMKYF